MRCESLSNFTDSVMMGKTAALLKDLLSAFIFDIFVDLDDLVSRDGRVCVVESEVDVDCCAGFVYLSHTEGTYHLICIDTSIN